MKWVLMLMYLDTSNGAFVVQRYAPITVCQQYEEIVKRSVDTGKLKAGFVNCTVLPDDSFNI